MLRESLAYQLGGLLQGEFPREQYAPKLQAFLDKVVTDKGRKLGEEVRLKLEAQGWMVWTEKKLTELLNRKLDRNYGDVDVLARKEDRVLIIECKDLKFPKARVRSPNRCAITQASSATASATSSKSISTASSCSVATLQLSLTSWDHQGL